MTLQDRLLRRREAIAATWYRRILETYPAQSVPFLSAEQDPFRNPIGGTVRPAVDCLVKLLAEAGPAGAAPGVAAGAAGTAAAGAPGGASTGAPTGAPTAATQHADPFRQPLDDIIRIRSVQGFSAADAVRFVLDLKQIVREQLAGDAQADLHAEPLASELAAFDQLIDRLVLLGFDIYMECREQLYALRAEEGRRRTAVLLRRFGMEWDAEPVPEEAAPPS